MGLFYLFIFFLLVILLLHFFTELPGRAKLVLFVVLAGIWIALWFFESSQSMQRDRDREVVLAFMQGQTLSCGEADVNSSFFNFVSGTMAFVGKAKTSYEGVIVPVGRCKTKWHL